MATFHSEKIPSQLPMSYICEGVTVYYTDDKSNDKELGTGKLYVTTDLTVWINDKDQSGFDFYLSDISKVSKEDDAILLSSESLHYKIKMVLKSHHDEKLAEMYKELTKDVKSARNPLIDEYTVSEVPEGLHPAAENIKFTIQPLDYHRGTKSGVAALYFTEEALLVIYNKEGPKLGSGYELKDIKVQILEESKQIVMKTEFSHFPVTITLEPENAEAFNSLCKKIEEAKIEKEITEDDCNENSQDVDKSQENGDS